MSRYSPVSDQIFLAGAAATTASADGESFVDEGDPRYFFITTKEHHTKEENKENNRVDERAPRLPPVPTVTPGMATALLPTNPPFSTTIFPYLTLPPSPSYMCPKSKASLSIDPYSLISINSGFNTAPMLST